MGPYESRTLFANPKMNKSRQYSNLIIKKNHFDFLYIIGRGGFGKVWKVNYKKTQKLYALKEMSKVKIIDRKSEKSIMSERELLAFLSYPFIVNMIFAFQDYENLYLVMDLLTGGDLRYHISRHKKFSEQQTKFFVGCLIVGLEYIHSNKVIHRDIKPENLVCDELGYVRITDFGVAKRYQKENSSETSGTPGYMAPEVLCAQNHTYAVDFFAIGVMAYEFMLGVRPYLGKSRKEIKEVVISKQAHVAPEEIPKGWSTEAADLINKLLQRKPTARLGYNGIGELKEHPWFNGFNWSDLMNKKTESPFIPKPGDNFDKKYCEGVDKIGNDTLERYQKYLNNENFAMMFRMYTYSNRKEEINKRQTPRTCVTSAFKRLSHSPTLAQSITKGKLIKNSDSTAPTVNSSTNNLQCHPPNMLSYQKSITPDKYKMRLKSNSISMPPKELFMQVNNIGQYNSMVPKVMKNTISQREKSSSKLPFLGENTKKSLCSFSNNESLLNKTTSKKAIYAGSAIKITGITKFSTISARPSSISMKRRSGSIGTSLK